MRSASGASPRVSLSGLPGVTSHQTRSRPRRCIASRQAARCAACGGSKVPPNRPMRRGRGACGGQAGSRPDVCPVPRMRYLNVVSCSTPTGPRACMRPVAMPISAPKPNSPPSANWVEALCSTIARVDLAQELVGRLLVGGDDRIGVVRAVALDMRDRGVDAVHDLRGDDRVEIFGRPVFFGRGFHARCRRAARRRRRAPRSRHRAASRPAA